MRLRSPKNWCQNHEALVFDDLSLTEFITVEHGVINLQLVTNDHSLKLWLHEVCVKNGNSSTITDWYLKLLLMMEAVHKKKCHSCCCFQVEDDLTRGYYFGAIGYGTRAEMKKRSWCISFNLLTALRKIFACWICKVAISSADPLPEPFSFCFPPCALFAVFLSILRLLMLIEM